MASTETNQCPTCGGSGWITGTANSAGTSGLVPCSHGKAPESPEARPSILELPEEQQVELYTRAAEASNEMQREVLERAQQPEATEPRHLQGWKPGWICGKHYAAHDRDCGYTGFRPPAPQPQQNAGELDRIWNDIRSTLASTAMKNMTIPQAKVFSAEATEYIGGHVKKLVDVELAAHQSNIKKLQWLVGQQAKEKARIQATIARERLAAVELFAERVKASGPRPIDMESRRRIGIYDDDSMQGWYDHGQTDTVNRFKKTIDRTLNQFKEEIK